MLSKQDYSRYSRQLLVDSFDIDSQQRLQNAHVVIIGLGGLGCVASQYLTGAGVGQLTLIDGDKVELSNLPRQPLYSETDIGQYKVNAASRRLQQCNSKTKVLSQAVNVAPDNIGSLIQAADLVLDCCDNMTTRQLINLACFQTNTPLISAAASGLQGQILPLNPDASHGCYRCLYAPQQAAEFNCLAQGIMGPVVGMMGMQQALYALFYFSGAAEVPWGQLLLFDGLKGVWQSLYLPANPQCNICGEHQ